MTHNNKMNVKIIVYIRIKLRLTSKQKHSLLISHIDCHRYTMTQIVMMQKYCEDEHRIPKPMMFDVYVHS